MPQIRLGMKWGSRGSLPRRKTPKPRKIDDVLRHSRTWRLAKSIFVWMPRLPTILVIGSQDFSMIWARGDVADMRTPRGPFDFAPKRCFAEPLRQPLGCRHSGSL